MITKDNLKGLLTFLGFLPATSEQDIYNLYFDDNNFCLSVDFKNEKFIYPSGIQADRKTSQDFSKPEFFVVFECICTLLRQGYKPEQIVLEPKTPGGREDSNFYCDILVHDNNNNPYLLIECKKADEYDAAWTKTCRDGGQLFRYYNSYRKAQYLCLYSSDFVDGKPKRDYQIIKMTDNEEQIRDTDIQSYAKVTADNGSYEDFFHVWEKTYEYDAMTNHGAFEKSVPPFGISNKKLNAEDDLRDVDNEEIRKKYNEFAVILRQHNVGSHENAFDKLVNLFLAKIVDEINNPDDLHFYWKGKSYDDDFSLQDRLQRLYRDGMKKFLHEDVTYIENSEIDTAFRWVQNDLDATKRQIKDFFRQLKFFSENDFSFISVHNKRLFDQNAKILRKVVRMLQNIRLRTNEENLNQLLGDLFEGFLNKGVKQNEGQFFTPMPIVRFIVSALPLEQIIKENEGAPYAIDYACGAGHFLTEYDFRIAEFAKKYHGDIPLSEYFKRTFGIEKEYRLSKVTKVSAFMYGHDDTTVIYADALNHIDEVKDEMFSVLVANPPYAVSGFLETLPEQERKRYTLYNKDINLDKNNAIETFFMERSAQLMKTGGVAGIVLPISVLNKDGIYTHAREIILQNFDIIALAKFGSGTFGKTGTNTVVMFLRRKETNTPEAEHYRSRVDSWFNAKHEADEIYEDADLLDSYCSHMGYDIEDYRQFLNGSIPNRMNQTEVIQNYRDSFFGNQRNAMKGVCKEAKKTRTKFKAREKTATFQRLQEDERTRISEEAFFTFVKAIEKDKIFYYILAFKAPCSVILMNMPSGKENESATKEGQKFLGYKWSDTKGNEGIKYLHVKKKNSTKEDEENDGNEEDDDTIQQIRGINGIITPLFNPNDLNDELKINTIIRKNFLGEEDEIPESLVPFVSRSNLIDMLDFSGTAFNKLLKNDKSTVKVNDFKTRYPLVKLKSICESLIAGGDKPDNMTIEPTEENFIPVYANGAKNNGLLGFTDTARVTKPSVSISARGTLGFCVYHEKPFFPIVRLIVATPTSQVRPQYLKSILDCVTFINEGSNIPQLSVPKVGEYTIPLPPISVQQQIIDECAIIDMQQEEYRHIINEELQNIHTIVNSLSGEKRKISKVCEINSTTINPTEHPNTEYIYIDIDAVQNGTGNIFWGKKIKGSEAPSRARRYAVKGSTLISTVRPNLRGFAFIDEEKTDAVYSTGFAILKSKDKIVLADKMIYYQFMYSDLMMHQMVTAMPQGSYPSINRGDIDAFDILVSINNQDEVLRELDDIELKIKKANAILEQIPQYKQAVLDKYLK